MLANVCTFVTKEKLVLANEKDMAVYLTFAGSLLVLLLGYILASAL